MEKRVIIGLAACVMVLSVLSCAKEQQKEDPQEDQNGLVTEILSATKEGDATKVTMNPSRVFGWSALDDVAFTIYKGGSYEFRTSDHYGQTEPGKFVVTHSGIRQGYAVMPASFQGSYDGSTLVVNYPDSYDISADVDGGCYDNAAVVNPETGKGTHFIPFPMVSVSNSATDGGSLTFYSIGAMAKVTVSDVPAGTKNLYITFNKPVTGTFPVANPGTADSKVSCSGTANTTVTVKISESGLASQQNITLYIPIPVCDEGLQVISSLTTPPKAALARNRGYAFATSAISSHNNNQPFFTFDDKLYEIAPGNLSKASGVSGTWSFLPNQVITQLDRHTTDLSSVDVTTIARDVFTLDELKSVFYNSAPDEEADFAGYTLNGTLANIDVSLAGKDGNEHQDWGMITYDLANKILNNNTSTGMVGGIEQAHLASVLVDVSGSEMSEYGLLNDSFNYPGNKYVYGALLFPNGYFDITDLVVADVNDATGDDDLTNKPIISYAAFKSMVDSGVIFFIAAGRHYYNRSPKWQDVGTFCWYNTGYVHSQYYDATDLHWPYKYYLTKGFRPGAKSEPIKNYFRKLGYFSVRLIREATITGNVGANQGDDWTWD